VKKKRGVKSSKKSMAMLRREFEYIRHGTLSWFLNFDVVTGHVIEPF